MIHDFQIFFNLGWKHIVSWDAFVHLLFILALVAVYTFKDLKKLFILITIFTFGYSVTLILSTLHIIKVPSNWVAFLIPLTIVIIALDNIFFRSKEKILMQLNYYIALIFGLVQGLGFANTAKLIFSKQQSVFIPLLGFNIGLEVAQLAVVTVIMVVFFIILNLFKVNKKDWLLFVSSGVFALALKMTLERLPF